MVLSMPYGPKLEPRNLIAIEGDRLCIEMIKVGSAKRSCSFTMTSVPSVLASSASTTTSR